MVDVSKLSDLSELRQLMKNAERLNRMDVYWEAFKRICEIQGGPSDDALEIEFHRMLAAYEELLAIKHGKRTAASRTRQKLANKGVRQCLEDWAVASSETQGFKTLIENSMPELTGEYLVVKYPNHFSARAVEAARRRLLGYGVSLDTIA